MRTSFRSGSDVSPAMLAGIVVALPIIGIAAFFFWNPGLFGKIWVILQYNELFWFLNVAGVGWAVYCWRRNPEEFTVYELPAQIMVSFILLLTMCSFFFYETTDIKDTEHWNGAYTHVVHEEGWTEHVHKTCTRTDSKGNTSSYDCSYNVYHPPTWTGYIGYGETVNLTPQNYQNLVSLWKTERQTGSWHSGQISFGDGRTFQVDATGNESEDIPTAREHRFVNYLKASKSVQLRSGIRGYEQYLMNYPEVHGGPYGQIELERVINAGGAVSPQWIRQVDWQLDHALMHMGSMHEINILVYVVGTNDRGFLHALEERWVFGKKNDLIVIVGCTNDHRISWVDCIAWTDHELFKTQLRDRLRALETLKNNELAFVNIITSQVSRPGEEGWERFPMEKKKYLVHDISLPLWANVIVALLYAGFAWLCSWAFANNEWVARVRRFDPYHRNHYH